MDWDGAGNDLIPLLFTKKGKAHVLNWAGGGDDNSPLLKGRHKGRQAWGVIVWCHSMAWGCKNAE